MRLENEETASGGLKFFSKKALKDPIGENEQEKAEKSRHESTSRSPSSEASKGERKAP